MYSGSGCSVPLIIYDMNRRVAWKVISSPNTYSLMVNDENGKECLVPRTNRHVNLLQRACAKVKHPEIWDDLVAQIGEAFGDK